MRNIFKQSGLLFLLLVLSACVGSPAPQAAQPGRLNVVATTSIVADVVRNVGGEYVEVIILLPVGTDSHSFQPTPQDVAKVAQADVVFANGAGLEEFLEPMLENAEGKADVVEVSDGIELVEAPDLHANEQDGEHTDEEDHAHAGGDPHTWFDPYNVIVWTKNIEQKLSTLDPEHAQVYADNAQAYQRQLEELDGWIREQVAQIPAANRRLVTDHNEFTYFVVRYGFEQVGTVIPSYSTLAQPSAQDLARLEDTVRELDVKAIFVGETVNPNLAQRVAQDTGTQLVYLYTASLSGPEGPAASYLDFMRYDVSAIVQALKQ